MVLESLVLDRDRDYVVNKYEQYLSPAPDIAIYIDYRDNVEIHVIQYVRHVSVFSIGADGLII